MRLPLVKQQTGETVQTCEVDTEAPALTRLIERIAPKLVVNPAALSGSADHGRVPRRACSYPTPRTTSPDAGSSNIRGSGPIDTTASARPG